MKYDDKGNLVSVATTGIKEDTDTYEGGNIIKTVTGGNGTYEYKYDDTSNPHRLTSVVNTLVSQEMTYNTTGNVTKTTLFATDNAENRAKNAYGKTLESSSVYNISGASGNLISSTTDTSGQTVTYAYEGAANRFYGRTTGIEDANGTTTNMSYDQFGRVEEKTLLEDGKAANTVGLSYTYTKGILSRVQRTDSSGNTQTYGYDHDSFGNLTEITVGDIVLAEYIYGPQNGYLQEQSYGNGDSIAYEYDNLGRTTKATYSSGRTLSYTYTGDGQVHSITDNNGTTDTADDLVYSYTYDTLGRTVDSQMCRGIQVLLKTHWEYDDANRIQSQSWQVGTTGYKEVYTYDEDDGSLVKITVEGDIQDANLIYDALRRLHQVTTDTYTKSYTYRDISSTRTTTQITGLSYTGKFNHTFGYTYDALGYISTYSPTAGETIQYGYDAQGQLTSVTEDGVTTIYVYDSVGNIREVKQGDTTIGSYTYGNSSWKDLLTAYNGGAIAYEGQTYNAETNTASGDPISGNPISYFNGNRWNFTWQNGRQLTSASATVGNTDIDISYTYDFDGLRTSKTVTYTTTEDEEHTHEYAETIVAATCTEDGYTIYTCSCGDSYLEDIVDALGHNYVESATETGTVFTCTRCGDSYAGHTHSYTETVTEPTCTAVGYTTYTCSCGDSYTGNTVAALGHNYVANGIMYVCTRCGNSYTVHQHAYAQTVTEPTCTEAGYTTYTCSCGNSYLDNIVDALGHNYVESETETGTVFTCSRCGDSYAGHTHSYTETVTAPTCTEAGYTTYTCSCGDSYTGNTVATLGHNYVQSGNIYTCSRCGDSYSGHQHTYTETVTEPDCERDGYTTYTCSCGYSYTDNVVPALGHDYVLAGQDGTTMTYACTRCGHTYTVIVPVVPNPPVEMSLRTSNVSVVTEHHEYIYASGKLLRETITTTDAEGNVSTQTLDFQYDNVGFPYALTYMDGAAEPVTYYYITNMQGDVVYLVDELGQEVAYYTYDPFGKVLTAEGDMAEINPLRYRGYYYDAESGFYYLQSRYYDPTICRYINADSYLSTGQGFLGYNAFAYCANNPINYTDSSGNFLDTIFDVVSIAFSVAEVIANPTDPWAWAGLAGDLIDMVPFVSGVGETVKAIGTVADVVDVVDDVRDAAKVVDAIDNIHDTGKIVDNISDAGDSFRAYSRMDTGCSGGWCFVAGTLVYTEDGNRAIEDIRVGDYVWATDPETGELE